MDCPIYKPPFPYAGGKANIAPVVWERFGNPDYYIEPFFGSGAVLFRRPLPGKSETVNDLDGMVSNFWRAVKYAPEDVARHAEWPIFENDLHARHAWLLGQRESLQARLEGDPGFFDAKVAGWWAWGACACIGFCWCMACGPWGVAERNGVRVLEKCLKGEGITRSRPVEYPPSGVLRRSCKNIYDYLWLLSERLKHVIVCCGDWSRVCSSKTTLLRKGITAVFLDPPYAPELRPNQKYPVETGEDISSDVWDWCLKHGNNPQLRIALCGYREEHRTLEDVGWVRHDWVRQGGYANRNKRGNPNRYRESIWFSPHCLSPGQKNKNLFGRCFLGQSLVLSSDGKKNTT